MATAPKSRSRKQPETRRFSRGRPYRRARQAWFDSDATNRLCAECLKLGKTTEATELDHIRRAADCPDLFHDPNNWQPLCRECHEAKTLRENSGEPLGVSPRCQTLTQHGGLTPNRSPRRSP